MRRYLAALIEQALWSLLNLGMNVALARFVAPDTYGSFVFWANCGFVLSSVQNAITLCHLQVLTPGSGLAPHRLETERIMHAVTVVFLLVVGLATLFVTEHSFNHPEFETPAAALFLPAYLFQQYLRSLSFSRGDSRGAAIQTGLVLLLSVALLIAAMLGALSLHANGIMILMATAYGVIGVGSAIRLCAAQFKGRPLPRLKDYAPFVSQSGWVFLGVTSAETLARLYTFVVAAFFGPGPLAAMAAASLFLRPLPLAGQAWTMGGRVDLLTRRDNRDWGGFMRWVIIAMGVGLAITLVWAPLIWLGWPLIAEHVFGGRYGDVRWMVAIWGVANAFILGQVVISAAIQVLQAFKALAIANATTSIVAAFAVFMSAVHFGPEGVLISTAFGMGLDMVVMLVLLLSLVRRRALLP